MSDLLYKPNPANPYFTWRGGFLCYGTEPTPAQHQLIEWAALEVEALGLKPTILPGREIFHKVMCELLSPPSVASTRRSPKP